MEKLTGPFGERWHDQRMECGRGNVPSLTRITLADDFRTTAGYLAGRGGIR